MGAATGLDDQLSAILIWAVLAFLLWLILSVLVQPHRIRSILVTASVSWIAARLLLWVLPTLLHRMEVWFRT
jgi:hypothetical protein